MKIMKRNIENRTILIISILVLIILAGYFILINLPVSKNYFSVEEVLLNKEKYLNNGTITIRGYYDSNLIAIVSTMSEVV
jgi:cytochrome c-type biogenesis protein CcmE